MDLETPVTNSFCCPLSDGVKEKTLGLPSSFYRKRLMKRKSRLASAPAIVGVPGRGSGPCWRRSVFFWVEGDFFRKRVVLGTTRTIFLFWWRRNCLDVEQKSFPSVWIL